MPLTLLAGWSWLTSALDSDFVWFVIKIARWIGDQSCIYSQINFWKSPLTLQVSLWSSVFRRAVFREEKPQRKEGTIGKWIREDEEENEWCERWGESGKRSTIHYHDSSLNHNEEGRESDNKHTTTRQHNNSSASTWLFSPLHSLLHFTSGKNQKLIFYVPLLSFSQSSFHLCIQIRSPPLTLLRNRKISRNSYLTIQALLNYLSAGLSSNTQIRASN